MTGAPFLLKLTSALAGGAFCLGVVLGLALIHV